MLSMSAESRLSKPKIDDEVLVAFIHGDSGLSPSGAYEFFSGKIVTNTATGEC